MGVVTVGAAAAFVEGFLIQPVSVHLATAIMSAAGDERRVSAGRDQGRSRVFDIGRRQKRFAKALRRFFDGSGFEFPLGKCQAAVANANAGGYRNWGDLGGALGTAERPFDPAAYRRPLLARLPEPCRPPLLFWLDTEPVESAPEGGISPQWYRHVFPYLMASSALHLSGTALLRPGSGCGAKNVVERLHDGCEMPRALGLHLHVGLEGLDAPMFEGEELGAYRKHDLNGKWVALVVGPAQTCPQGIETLLQAPHMASQALPSLNVSMTRLRHLHSGRPTQSP